MALGSGISYRDWVALSKDDPLIDLTLTSGTELVTINNVLTPRPRQFAKITPHNVLFLQQVNFELVYTYPIGEINDYDGNEGMTIGCFGLIGLDVPLGTNMYIETLLFDQAGNVIDFKNAPSAARKFKDANYFVLLDNEVTGVYKVHVSILYTTTPGYTSMNLGRLWVGNYMGVDFSNDYNFSHGEGARESVSVGNDSYLNFRRPRKNQQFNLELQPKHKVYGAGATWFDLSKTVSTNTDLIVLPDTTDSESLQYLGIYGKLKKPCNLQRTGGQYWTATLDVLELI